MSAGAVGVIRCAMGHAFTLPGCDACRARTVCLFWRQGHLMVTGGNHLLALLFEVKPLNGNVPSCQSCGAYRE